MVKPQLLPTKTVAGASGTDISESTSYKDGGTSKATYFNIYSCGCNTNPTQCKSGTHAISALQSTVTIVKLMKKIILIFLFLTSSISSALACDVKIIPFGSGKEKININPLPLSFPNQFDSETVIVPISDICKNDKDLFGTNVNFFIHKKQINSNKFI